MRKPEIVRQAFALRNRLNDPGASARDRHAQVNDILDHYLTNHDSLLNLKALINDQLATIEQARSHLDSEHVGGMPNPIAYITGWWHAKKLWT